MDFLLECIGFSPNQDLDELAELVEQRGEPSAYRGPGGLHRRLPLGGGLELRLDRETPDAPYSLWPYFQSPHRLRVAVRELRNVPDQPFDALLDGLANPPIPIELADIDEPYELSCYLNDARRLPAELVPGHVIAVSMAGFALDVGYSGPADADGAARSGGRLAPGSLEPLARSHEPGGCMELALRIRSVRHIHNPITGAPVDVLECEAPGRPLVLFVSQWQLEQDQLASPHPGQLIEGVFLLLGRIAGGLPPKQKRRAPVFG